MFESLACPTKEAGAIRKSPLWEVTRVGQGSIPTPLLPDGGYGVRDALNGHELVQGVDVGLGAGNYDVR